LLLGTDFHRFRWLADKTAQVATQCRGATAMSALEKETHEMKKYLKSIVNLVLLGAFGALAGCASMVENGKIYTGAEGKIVRMTVTYGDSEGHTVPHAFFPADWNFNATAKQYRWVHVLATSNVDDDTNLHTIALVPDQIPELHYGDWVEVKFHKLSATNFGELQADSAVVTKVLCRASDSNECRRKITWSAKNWRYPLGETNEPVPDMNQFTFSKYYDQNGDELPEISLPQ
jgi:hypothetical protein